MILNDIRKKLLDADISKDNSIIRGLWGVDCLFQPEPNERVFDCKFLVAESSGLGSAYTTNDIYSREYLRGFVGKNYFDLSFNDFALEVAVMDSLFEAAFNPPDYIEYILNGHSNDKLKTRSEIIASEALALVDGNTDIEVVNVGVVGGILKAFKEKNVSVCGTDFDKDIVDTFMFDEIPIVSGDETLKKVAASDIAVVTGMTLTTSTIDDIIYTAKENNTKLVMFAETGASFASVYLENGVDVFISEPFPFYIFNGESKMRIFRRN